MYEELLRLRPGFSLATAIDLAETEFCRAFIEVWGLEADRPPDEMDRDDWLACRRVYGEANSIAAVAAALVHKKGLGPAILAPAGTYSKTRSKLPLGISLPATLDEVAGRLESLVKYVVRSQNERANAYLSRVATCYCLGLCSELSVMARAVLDTALQDVVSDESVRKGLSLANHVRIGLGNRLQYLQRYDLVADAPMRAMERIKNAGDDAVHTAPGLEPQPDTTMTDLVAAIGGVEELRGRLSTPEGR